MTGRVIVYSQTPPPRPKLGEATFGKPDFAFLGWGGVWPRPRFLHSPAVPGGCRTQRWEGSRPRPAAAGLFPKPSVFVDRVIRIRL